MVCFFFPSLFPSFLFLFFSQANTRSDTSEVRKSKESRLALHPPSLRSIKPSSRLSTSGGRWPSSAGTYCSLTTRWYSKGIGLERGYPREFDPINSPCAITTTIVTPYHERQAFALTRFRPGNTRRGHDARKRSRYFEMMYMSRRWRVWWSITHLWNIESVINEIRRDIRQTTWAFVI